jgi:aryl-alcohol dehydrogenase-like predicted oxidoreductase
MKYRNLGNTDIKVSSICLGTMTYGDGTDMQSAHKQLDVALELGINYIDTAELYPVPPSLVTYGASERIIGDWLARRRNRDRVVIGSKIVGPLEDGEGEYIRDGKTRLNKEFLKRAVTDSLRRLQTDYLDLYQLHWPERSTNYFKRLNYRHVRDERVVPIEETLDALWSLRKEGLIRAYGVSNETPWGVMKFLAGSAASGADKIATVQNPYNLLNRTFEIGLAEVCCRENVGLLAYSPLGFGVLSGNTLGQNGQKPKAGYFNRYSGEGVQEAVRQYVEIAHAVSLDPAQMALAFILQQPFTTAVIIGATSEEQLRTNIASHTVTLSQDVINKIDAVHLRVQNICP